jgi:hypothetical protein
MPSFGEVDADSYDYPDIFLRSEGLNQTQQTFATYLVKVNVKLLLTTHFGILILNKSIWLCFWVEVVFNYLQKGCFP